MTDILKLDFNAMKEKV